MRGSARSTRRRRLVASPPAASGGRAGRPRRRSVAGARAAHRRLRHHRPPRSDAKRLDGTLRLTWRNPSTDTVADLWFHLYLNAFRDQRQHVLARVARPAARRRDAGRRLGLDRRHRAADRRRRGSAAGADVRGARRRQSPGPDGGARAAAAAGRRPAAASMLDIAFRAVLPQAYARTGYAGDYFLVGAVVPEDRRLRAGRRRAAAPPAAGTPTSSTPTRSSTPTSATTASPSRCRRASSSAPPASAPPASTTRDGTTTHTYEQGDVHDFAWTASPRFVEITRRFDAATAGERPRRIARPRRASAGPIDELRLGDVEVRLLMQPEHLPQAERYLRGGDARDRAVRPGLRAPIRTAR